MRRTTGTHDPARAPRRKTLARVAAWLAILGAGAPIGAAEPGRLGATSQAAIRITASVAPRISYRSLVQIETSAALPRGVMLRCAYLNSGTGAFDLVPDSLGDINRAAVSARAAAAVGPRAGALPGTAAAAGNHNDCSRGWDRAWHLPEEPGSGASAGPRVLLVVAQ